MSALMVPQPSAKEMSDPKFVVGLAYPAFALALLMAAAYTVIAASSMRARLLGTAGLTMFIADALFNGALNSGDYQVGGLEDLFWLLTYVLVATSAAFPSVGSSAIVKTDPDNAATAGNTLLSHEIVR